MRPEFLRRAQDLLGKISGGKPPEIETSSLEKSSNIEINYWDLTDPEKAKERGVVPGHYLTLFPIFPQDIEDPMLLHRHMIDMMKKFTEIDSRGSSEAKIHVDTDGNYVDPAKGWQLSAYGYLDQLKMLVVRGEMIDRDEAQGQITSSFLNKTYKVIPTEDTK